MLKTIFESITPDNIKDLPLVKDAMAIFIEIIEESSELSFDVKRLYTSDNPAINRELAKIFLRDLYVYVNKIDSSKELYERLQDFSPENRDKYLNISNIKNIIDNIGEDDYAVIKNFKENKGTFDALNYVYSIVKDNTESVNYDEETFFELEENDTFVFTLKGAVDKGLYKSLIAPIAQPLGFLLKEYINTLI